MTFAAVTLLGMTLGQPLASDLYPMNQRTIKLPIQYKPGQDRKAIQHVLLYVAHNGENTWYQEAFVTPSKDPKKEDAFVYVAKEDGIYWFKMVIVDMKGNKDPADMTREPPDLRILVDTVQPQVQVTTAKRNGDEITVAWNIEDKNPNDPKDPKTKVDFKPTADPRPSWQEVTIPANSPTGVKFPCGTNEAVTVRITAVDLAGNRTEITKDFPAAGSTSLSSPNSVTPTPPVGTGTGTPPAPVDVVPVGSGALSPLPPGPLPPAGPAPAGGPAPAPVSTGPITPAAGPGPVGSPPVIQAPPAPPVQQPPSYQTTQPVTPYQLPSQPYQPPAVSGGSGGPTPLPTVDPKAQPTGQSANATPTGAWTGAAPAAELPRAQIINYARFDLGFDLEQRGPSGISRVDLWVTRDEGKSWAKWSQHDGKGGAVRVALDVRENANQLEGNYGFRLVPVSGAGLSEREPAAGDAPDMRVVVDVTPPQIDLFPPASDPNTPDTLVIQWRATDRNFGDDPITLEWSDAPAGPWKPIASAGNDPVVQTTAINVPVAKRLANTGQYAWRVPAGIPPRVYLKATARDAAGNVKEVVTRDPILVDLTKPKAKISGIVPPPIAPRP